MKRSQFSLLSYILAALCFSSVAVAENTTRSVPDLKGVWEGEYTAFFPNGQRKARIRIEITEQDGIYLRGTNKWEHIEKKEPITYSPSGEPISEYTDPIVGVVGFDNRRISFAEDKDLGIITAELIDNNTMQAVYTEPGPHALVFRVELTRKAK